MKESQKGTAEKYDRITGKPLDKAYLEKDLPAFLQYDLDEYKHGLENNVSHMDCLWSELYGSINSAFHGGRITEEQATYLRTYLFEDTPEEDFLW